jgi:predicted glycosyltransferase
VAEAVKVWVDLANSPHVPVFRPIVRRLRDGGDEVFLTARDHAQTVELARAAWGDVEVIGGASAPGLAEKAGTLVARALKLRRHARRVHPDVALSHGSYAQILAARAAGVPAVTMMDYEHQPANHLSFRLAQRVVVPGVFPDEALRRFGARRAKVVAYDGFKEELYLDAAAAEGTGGEELHVDAERVLVVMRPPPSGALYHRHDNDRFEEVLELARLRPDVEVVLLPRTPEQADYYRSLEGVRVPERAVDGRALLARADVVVGAGGTMNREAALLGTPTYTVFSGRLGCVDAELLTSRRMFDLRDPCTVPRLERKARAPRDASEASSEAILDVIEAAVQSVVRVRRRPVPEARERRPGAGPGEACSPRAARSPARDSEGEQREAQVGGAAEGQVRVEDHRDR